MKIINSLNALQTEYAPSVIALGTFDGLHLGHRDVIAAARNYAVQNGLKLIVFTFSNHPFALINPKHIPLMLIEPEKKAEVLASWGVDILVNVEFDRVLSNLNPNDFLQKLNIFNYKCLVVGENFTYGFSGSGKTEELLFAGKKEQFEVIVRKLIKSDGDIVSSTNIRKFIHAGCISSANKMLGRQYSLSGIVVQGEQRGRNIGFPTANIEVAKSNIAVPAVGGYMVRVDVNGRLYDAVANIGDNPTFGDVKNVRLETHLLDFSGDLYGQEITVYFYEFLRKETKFNSVEDLKLQIAADIIKTKKYFYMMNDSCV